MEQSSQNFKIKLIRNQADKEIFLNRVRIKNTSGFESTEIMRLMKGDYLKTNTCVIILHTIVSTFINKMNR